MYLDGNQASLISRNIPSWPPTEETPCRRERATVSICRFSVSSAPVRIASPSKAPAKDQKPQFFLGAWFGNEDPEARFFFLLTQTSHDSGFCNSRHRRCCQVAREATLAAESRFRASTRAATSKAEEDVCHSRRNRRQLVLVRHSPPTHISKVTLLAHLRATSVYGAKKSLSGLSELPLPCG